MIGKIDDRLDRYDMIDSKKSTLRKLLKKRGKGANI